MSQPFALQLVPPTTGAADGVGDYARAIGERSNAMTITRIVADGVGTDSLLVHWANYGYAKRGCPVGLVRRLVEWRGAKPGRRLVVFFHELYATGQPWQSSFWISPVQRHLARRLARTADGIVTSLALYASILESWRPRAGVERIPVPSTVGEPRDVTGYQDRPARLALFGSAGVRRRALEEERPALETAVRALSIDELVEIGPEPIVSGPIAGVAVRSTGRLEAAEVSRELLECRAGFLAYPPSFLEKSTLAAAYAAHRLTTLCAWSGRDAGARFARGEGESWLRVDGAGIGAGEAAAVAAAAFAAYPRRSIARHAERLAELLRR